MIRGDASEVYELAADLAEISAKSVPAARRGAAEGAKVVERAWRNNAIQTSGAHAKFYPDSIDSELLFGVSSIAAEIGPNTAKKQGKLGRPLEFGGRRSPAHLDGARALSDNEGRIERAFDQALKSLFG